MAKRPKGLGPWTHSYPVGDKVDIWFGAARVERQLLVYRRWVNRRYRSAVYLGLRGHLSTMGRATPGGLGLARWDSPHIGLDARGLKAP